MHRYLAILGLLTGCIPGPISPTPLSTPTTEPSSAVSPSPSVSPTPVTNARYLLIGDSHSDFYGNPKGTFGYFGQHLQELVPNLSVYAVSGSTPSWWTTKKVAKWGCTKATSGRTALGCALTPLLSDLLPGSDVVIFEQGANMQGWSDPKVKTEVQSIIPLLGGRKCFWVGAPPAPASIYSQADQDRLEASLRTSVAPCVYLSSHFFTFEQGHTHDEHLNMHAAGIWAEGIAAKIQ